MPPELLNLFHEINREHFDQFLDPPELRWNPRLRASAGRFIPGSRKFWQVLKPTIEVASYLREKENALELIKDTVAHEMIHYWLWTRRKPYGHTPEFWEKMTQMGVSRYNRHPMPRPYKYIYRCQSCTKDFLSRKKLGVLACADCCKKHARGQFDARFVLIMHKKLDRTEGLELSAQKGR